MVRWLVNSVKGFCKNKKGYSYLQKCNLVNIKLKWAKDKVLDEAVSGQRDLKAALILVSLISSAPETSVPIYRLRLHRRQLGIPDELKLSTFIRRYPSVFQENYFLDSAGTPVPAFGLTAEASILRQEELNVLQQNQMDLVDRVRKLLMLVRHTTLPLQTIDQLKWDLGLPYDYQQTLIPNFPDLFSTVKLEDERVGLKLLSWDNRLAISHLQKNVGLSEKNLAFPIGFTRGFGLRRKCTEWLEDWQKLPYTSPYSDASHLDPRTDVSEKRIVGVFHELLHLTIHKQTERKNVSNLRKPLGLPQKFTKVFERHPGIFYLSKKSDTQTVVLRDAFNGSELLEKHPLVDIRRKYGALMDKGFLDRSRGLYRKAEDVKELGV
ncbi:protein WHAT'S THIS FACTOR 9, mitochondrial [Silene latifolia]|uniref:protein WHAT'S THIS FACTOR 9, mitochondrial n=1 Tax=Silene latifolia TaxID=37657 RepID=UPI003D77005D